MCHQLPITLADHLLLGNPRREQDLVERQLPSLAADLLQSRGFVPDGEDLSVRDLENFDDLVAREHALKSVLFFCVCIYNKILTECESLVILQTKTS